MRSNELGYEVPLPEMRFTSDPMPAPEVPAALLLFHGGQDAATYLVRAYPDGLVVFEGLRNVGALGIRWRRAPPSDITALEGRLCRSRLGSSSIAVDRRHPHAALAVESCTPRIQIDFDTLGTDDASARGQHALDDVLDSLRVRPFARLARQP
jgi:hypothetical protein